MCLVPFTCTQLGAAVNTKNKLQRKGLLRLCLSINVIFLVLVVRLINSVLLMVPINTINRLHVSRRSILIKLCQAIARRNRATFCRLVNNVNFNCRQRNCLLFQGLIRANRPSTHRSQCTNARHLRSISILRILSFRHALLSSQLQLRLSSNLLSN